MDSAATKGNKMTNEINKIEWALKNGWTAIVTITHVLTEDINADGHIVTVKCDRVDTMLNINSGKIVERNFYMTSNVTEKVKSAGAFATIDTDAGVVGIPKNIYNEITASIASFTPEKEIIPEPTRGAGWCDKCASYCFGDCEA